MRAVYFLGAFLAMGMIAAFAARLVFSPAEDAAGQAAEPTGFVSGPQVGDKIPGPFEPFNINGEQAGEEACLYCRYGNAPVAMVFATKPSDSVATLLQVIDRGAQEAAKTAEVGACLVVTERNDETKKALTKLVDRDNYKKVIVGMIEPRYLKKYKLHSEAEVTVLLYEKQVIRVNHAFKPGELTEKTARELGDEAAKFFAAK